MLQIHTFTCNPFQENTYLVIDDIAKECIMIDPGAYTATEQMMVENFIFSNQLKPTLLLLTHAHLDHIFGLNVFVKKYKLLPHIHEEEKIILNSALLSGQKYGVSIEDYDGETITLKGETTLMWNNHLIKVLFTPGHSPGSVSYLFNDNILFGGDVLFLGSYGRTDLSMGNHKDLKHSIEKKLFSLPEETIVYAGHGDPTTIGRELNTNPILFS